MVAVLESVEVRYPVLFVEVVGNAVELGVEGGAEFDGEPGFVRGDGASGNVSGRRSCASGVGSPVSPRRAARHTAPIGNLGMRTQATRHSNCTADLHGSMSSSPSALLHQNGHASLARTWRMRRGRGQRALGRG